MRRLIKAGAIVGVAFGTGVAGTAVLNAAIDAGPVETVPTKTVNAELARNFAVFRAAESSVAADSQTGSQVQVADTGMNSRLSRFAGANSEGSDRAVFTPSVDGLCIGSELLGVLTCGNTGEALQGSVIGTVICGRIPADRVQVLGAFPDNVKSARAELSDGSTTIYPVRSNTLMLSLPKDHALPIRITIKAADGAQHTYRTGVPERGSLSCS